VKTSGSESQGMLCLTGIEFHTCLYIMQDILMFRLLDLMQAGLLVSYSYPDHCDALALMNAVYALATQ
jgi:hypothetical protein